MTTLEKIQAYCRQRGMSQAAIDLGVKRSQVNAWLEGSKKPSLDVVDKFIALGWEPGAELKAQSAASAEAAPVASSPVIEPQEKLPPIIPPLPQESAMAQTNAAALANRKKVSKLEESIRMPEFPREPWQKTPEEKAAEQRERDEKSKAADQQVQAHLPVHAGPKSGTGAVDLPIYEDGKDPEGEVNQTWLEIQLRRLVKSGKALTSGCLNILRDLFFQWQGRQVMVLFPCYKYTNPATAWCLVALALDLGKEKARFDMELGDGMIYHSRNKLADRFLASGAEWSLWIDDDMIVPIGRPQWFKQIGRLPDRYSDAVAGRHVVTRLISHGKKIVGGTYFGRSPIGAPMFAEMRDAQKNSLARAMHDGVMKTDWVATGCLLVHRSVYLDIQAKFPELGPKAHRKEWDFFLPSSDGGEDVMFCRRAAAAGHEVFVDTGLQCLHVGFACYGAHNTTNTGGK